MTPNLKSEVRKCLAAIAEEVSDNIHSINSGGCAVYAVELAKRLKRLKIKDMKIRVYSYRRDDNRRLPKLRVPWGMNGVFFCHVRMEWDAEGDVPARKSKVWNTFYQKHPGDISVTAMNKLAAVKSNWNCWFDRRQIPQMRRIMDKHFAALKAIMEAQPQAMAA